MGTYQLVFANVFYMFGYQQTIGISQRQPWTFSALVIGRKGEKH